SRCWGTFSTWHSRPIVGTFGYCWINWSGIRCADPAPSTTLSIPINRDFGVWSWPDRAPPAGAGCDHKHHLRTATHPVRRSWPSDRRGEPGSTAPGDGRTYSEHASSARCLLPKSDLAPGDIARDLPAARRGCSRG